MADLPAAVSGYLALLFAQGLFGFVALCWYFVFIDLPRYVVTDMMVLLRYLRRSAEAKDGPALQYSVVVPVWNEADTLPETIRSLEEQSQPPRQIIVVNDGSTDHTPRVCRALAARSSRIRYLNQGERGGKSAALNRGLQHVSTEVVVFVDADTTFDRDSMRNLTRRFNKADVLAVGGNLRVRNRRANLLTELQGLEYGLTIFLGRQAKARLDILPIISGAFGAFRTRAVRAVGGHDPGPGNDSDLTIDLRKHGGHIEFAHDAVCHTTVPVTLNRFTKQRRRWSRNVVKNRLRKHGNLFSPFTRGFSLLNLLSTLDPVAFQVYFSWIWIVYVIQTAIMNPHLIVPILFANWILYFLSATTQQVIVVLVSERQREDLSGFLFLPLYHFYRVYQRLVMMLAQVEEVFTRASLRDPFAPKKVRRLMPDW